MPRSEHFELGVPVTFDGVALARKAQANRAEVATACEELRSKDPDLAQMVARYLVTDSLERTWAKYEESMLYADRDLTRMVYTALGLEVDDNEHAPRMGIEREFVHDLLKGAGYSG